MPKKWNKLYLIMGFMILVFSVYLISVSFYFKVNTNNINYAAAIDKARTSQDIDEIREFLIHNLEYQQDLEQNRVNVYLYSGLILFISSLFILGASRKIPVKSTNLAGTTNAPPG